MQQGYRYIDADSHILEPLDLWERYLEPEYHSEMPYTFVGYTGDPLAFTVKVIIGEYGMPYSHEGSSSPLPGLADVYMNYVNQGFTPECYTDAMARVGMDYYGPLSDCRPLFRVRPQAGAGDRGGLLPRLQQLAP